MDKWTDGWIDGRITGWTDKWMDRWTKVRPEGWIDDLANELADGLAKLSKTLYHLHGKIRDGFKNRSVYFKIANNTVTKGHIQMVT